MTHIAEFADIPVEELRTTPIFDTSYLIRRERELAAEAVEHLYEEAMLGIAGSRMVGDLAYDDLAEELLADRNLAARFIRGYA